MALVNDFFANNPDGVYLYKELREDLGVTDASNFNKRVRRHDSYKDELDRLDIEEIATGNFPYRNALARMPSPFGPIEDASYFVGV